MTKYIPRILSSLLLISLIQLSVNAQNYSLAKSSISNSSQGYISGNIALTHTIGQSSMINAVNSANIQLLQGFEYMLIAKRFQNISIPQLTAYPNPTEGIVTVKWTHIDSNEVYITIFDLKGAVVKTYTTDGAHPFKTLDLSLLPKGLYKIQVSGAYNEANTVSVIIK